VPRHATPESYIVQGIPKNFRDLAKTSRKRAIYITASIIPASTIGCVGNSTSVKPVERPN
jgi:hypothetical protein